MEDSYYSGQQGFSIWIYEPQMNATERSEMDEHFNSDKESNLRRWEKKERLLGCWLAEN